MKQQTQKDERRSKEKGRHSTSSAATVSSSAASRSEEKLSWKVQDLSNLEGDEEYGEGDAETDGAAVSSEGSKLHAKGQCKPCAFFHTTGCQTGETCKFCHLCPPREVQRRKQIRRRIQREILHRTEAALIKASGVPGATQHQQQRHGAAQAALGAAWAQAQFHPVVNAFGAVSLGPFAPMATPMLHAYLGGGFPGSYAQQPEAPAGPSSNLAARHP